MPSKILAFVGSPKARPFLIGGGLLIGGIVLFMLVRGGSSGASSGAAVAGGPSEALQAAQLQASTQIALGQQAVDASNASGAMQLQGFMYGKDSDLALGNLQAGVALATLSSQTQLGLANIDASKTVALAQTSAQAGAVAQQFQYLNNQTNAQFDYLALQSSNQRDIDMSQIGAQERANQAQQKTARNASNNSTIASIAGGILMAFSDERMKTRIYWTGQALERNPAGRGFTEYGRYDWTWRDGRGTGHGVIAQEIATAKPEAIAKYRRGRMMVNYEAVV